MRKPPEPAGGIADDLALFGLDHADHELDDGSGGEELADLASESAPEEALEGDALYIFAGVGEVVAFESPGRSRVRCRI